MMTTDKGLREREIIMRDGVGAAALGHAQDQERERREEMEDRPENKDKEMDKLSWGDFSLGGCCQEVILVLIDPDPPFFCPPCRCRCTCLSFVILDPVSSPPCLVVPSSRPSS